MIPHNAFHMTDEDLLALDKRGFIPGPGENEENFLKRVSSSKKKFQEGSWIPEPHWDWVRTYLNQIYYVKPLYICAFYSNRRLAPWQGACAWVNGRQLDSIQLRKSLKKGTYLGMYDREEILAHEAVHAARSGFDEDVFEEFFAYMTSEKKWRRIFGPILQRPWEIWPLLVFAILGAFWAIFYWMVAFWVGLGLFRLAINHRILKRAGKQIISKVSDERKMRAILFRLKDEEIKRIARGEKVESVVKNAHDLRWRVIQSFLKESSL